MRLSLLMSLALLMPFAAPASEEPERDYTVMVRQTLLTGALPKRVPPLQCTEGDEDRTPHTQKPLPWGPAQVWEQSWTSTGQEPVVCRQGDHILVTLKPPIDQKPSDVVVPQIENLGNSVRVTIRRH